MNFILFLSLWTVQGETLKLSITDKWNTSRAIYGETKNQPPLMQAKAALLAEDFRKCYALTLKGINSEPLLKLWLSLQLLECALGEAQDPKVGVDHLVQATTRIKPHFEWFAKGGQTSKLKNNYVEALLLISERSIKTGRTAATKALRELEELRAWLTKDQLASVFRLSGELQFLAQNLIAAEDFFSRSLELHDSEDLRARIEALRKSLPLREKIDLAPPRVTVLLQQNLEATETEENLYQRISSALKSGDPVAAATDGLRLFEQFPGGRRAKWTQDRLIEAFILTLQRTEPDVNLSKDRMLRLLLKSDGGRLFDWAQVLFQKGFYSEALEFSQKSYSQLRGIYPTTKILRLASRAALLIGDDKTAYKNFEILMREHAGTPEAVEAHFRRGLLYYRRAQWSDAVASFERVQVLTGAEDYQYSALYWYWRSLQKMNSEKALPAAEMLVRKYPLSYYGLKSRAELNNGVLELPKETKPLKAEILLTNEESETFKRFQKLVALNYFKEAQEELKFLPKGHTPQQKLLMSRFAIEAFDNNQAFSILNQAFDQNPSLLRLDTLALSFPKEFSAITSTESKKYVLQENLLQALMRQESGFKTEAVSSGQAYGLMQLQLPTAKEIGAELNLKSRLENPKALFEPALNIKIGALYLSRLLRNYKGSLPLALAAYNVGQGRMKRFLNARSDAADVEGHDEDLWVDELPWPETSFYVKAVLRNYIIYQWLEKGELKLLSPVWK